MPLDLYVLMDVSMSMTRGDFAGTTKWDAVRTAMNDVLRRASRRPASASASSSSRACKRAANATCTMRRSRYRAVWHVRPLRPPQDVRWPGAVDDRGLAAVRDRDHLRRHQTCSLIKDRDTGGNYCAAGPTAPATACHGDAPTSRATATCATSATPPTTRRPTSDRRAARIGTRRPGRDAEDVAHGQEPRRLHADGAGADGRAHVRAPAVSRSTPATGSRSCWSPTGFARRASSPASRQRSARPIDIPGIAAIAERRDGHGRQPAGPTFVIGVSSPATRRDRQTNLDMLATGGGTATAVIIDTSQDVSQRAAEQLAEVQTKAIACEYKLPCQRRRLQEGQRQLHERVEQHRPSATRRSTAPTGAGLRRARRLVLRQGSRRPARRPKITACPASCSMFQTDLNGHVDVVLGCPTVDVD